MTPRLFAAGVFLVILTGATAGLQATMPPRPGGRFPELVQRRLTERPETFALSASLVNLVKQLQQNKFELFSASADFAKTSKPHKLRGTRTIPLLMVQFSDSAKPAITAAELERGLFTAPSGSGTLGDYFKEVSYGAFSLSGKVFDWKLVSKPQSVYAGGEGCNGACMASQVPAMVREALEGRTIDWSPFDNDGVDGKPNSGDDDGFVDFVGFVHPGKGGECGETENLWSIQSNLPISDVFTTTTKRTGGGLLAVRDYVVVPSLSCDPAADGKSPKRIEIGVYAHEFGHALGLPDLYSTNKDYPSLGSGNWCLMGTGSWGGDSGSPDRPTHLSAWAKGFLGWMTPDVISAPRPLKLQAAERTAAAYSTSIGGTVYYLAERRELFGSDAELPAAGLLLWRIDAAVVDQGLIDNSVNNDPANPGIRLIEADGSDDLITGTNGAAAGDVFRAGRAAQFDASTSPQSEGSFAMCGVGIDGSSADIGLGGPCPLGPVLASNPGRAAGRGRGAPSAPPPPLQSVPDQTVSLQAMNVGALVRSAPDLMTRGVTVSGTLRNAGSNYFTDRRLVLVGGDGSTVPVDLAPTVIETAPPAGRGGQPQNRLSELLGQRLELTGRLQKIRNPNGTTVVVFVAERIQR